MDKIICLGKNYIEHAKELGDAIPEKPVLFIKPPSASIQVPQKLGRVEVILPKNHGAIHYECEILLRVGSHRQIEAVTLGLDLTLRDLQTELKKKGHPWEISKVFYGSAVIGPWIPVSDFSNYLDQEFRFYIGGSLKQKGIGKAMRISPEECVAYSGEFFPIEKGDIFFTGTPAGVGPVQPNEKGELYWGADKLYEVLFK